MFTKKLWIRHSLVAMLSVLLISLFWFSRLDWDPEMRLWRAVGDTSWILLCTSLILGPLARLWQPLARLIPWRRQIGIWFGILALSHGLLILDGWVRWDVMRFFGYEYVDQLGRQARLEPGFGLSNLLGLVSLIWALILTATSSNWALRKIGSNAWKWLHSAAYIIFYLVFLHVFYFLFIHYTLSFHRSVPPNANWLGIPFLIVTLSVPVLQILGFAKTIGRRSKRLLPNNEQVQSS